MIGPPTAHVLGIPIEESLGLYGPALLLMLSAASATLGIRLHRVRERQRARRRREPPRHATVNVRPGAPPGRTSQPRTAHRVGKRRVTRA